MLDELEKEMEQLVAKYNHIQSEFVLSENLSRNDSKRSH